MATTFLIVPGYTNSGPDHWQSHLERKYSNVIRVIQNNWNNPTRQTWVDCLNKAIQKTPGNIVLLGHSCGAVSVAQWAASHLDIRIKAVVLVAPADVDAATALPEIREQRPLPSRKLIVPSLLICSDNDEHLSHTRAHELAAKWGSEIIVIERGGHLHTAAGYGEWPTGEDLIEKFTGEKFTNLEAGA